MKLYDSIRDGIQHLIYKVIDPGVRAAVKIGITPNVVTTLGMLGNAAGAAMLVYAALYAEKGDYSLVGWARSSDYRVLDNGHGGRLHGTHCRHVHSVRCVLRLCP